MFNYSELCSRWQSHPLVSKKLQVLKMWLDSAINKNCEDLIELGSPSCLWQVRFAHTYYKICERSERA
jgi:hypothetical protein